MLLQTFASAVKFELKGYSLHVYDVIFVGADGSIMSFLATHYFSIFSMAVLILFVAMAFLWCLYRFERPLIVAVRLRVPVVMLGIGAAFAAHPAPRPGDPPFVFGFNASSLLLSLWHIPHLIDESPLEKVISNVQAGERFADTVQCDAAVAKPDVFVVLSESQTSPLLFSEIDIPDAVTSGFTSGDGKIRPLFVETFGGGTWMSNFSVLTGLSSADFQWQAPYVNQLLEGRIKGAVPEVLSRCGYRTVAIMPMKFHALNEGPFLKSIGFQEVYDGEAMGLASMEIRDRGYFAFAEKIIKEHRKSDERPLFIAMQTMFPHAPYANRLVPTIDLPAHDFKSGEDVSEYMRRVYASRLDFRAFLEKRRQQPGNNGSVLVDFGDHQSVATKEFALKRYDGENAFVDFRSIIYQTYFSVHGFGVDVDYTSLSQPEDVAYLMARVAAAAKLPTSPVFQDLLRLSDLCAGRFHTCENRSEIDLHLKKRANAGLLALD
ncbi:sulfatase-like hydrolase/transferase [Rhizobium sp. KVB221]|uniref:Sulfatase-like hydrolase/transferase n=1 Tax=Rhizobium setariae TaxID=2801340 RepID=A0A936YNG5_9HYPH|nr:sulfatase-like hydrolase/transferase [Rhizobium setariae]MBL0371359.1 sulfatase-like hydrolase/transferase [Rhizobium setariae]